jgi:hypothetical protein
LSIMRTECPISGDTGPSARYADGPVFLLILAFSRSYRRNLVPEYGTL